MEIRQFLNKNDIKKLNTNQLLNNISNIFLQNIK